MEMTEKGSVASIVYRNDETGYTVLVLDTIDGDKITCVGTFPALSVGTVLEVKGTDSYHARYGEQLSVSEYKVCNPTTREGIVKYLSSGLIKGVGETTANNIYKAFGDDTFGVIENNPGALAKVKGISVKKAMDIANAVAELKDMQQQIMFLQGYGITTHTALKIYNIYKQQTKSIVLGNPYRLIDDIDGIGFFTADKIAQSIGHEQISKFRFRAALVFALKETAEKQGNTYLPFNDLISQAGELLGVNLGDYGDLVENTVAELVLEPLVKDFEVRGERCIALIRYYKLESSIATKLISLNRDARRLAIDADSLIAQFETVNKITLHQGQKSAVKAALTNGVTVITGGPGTGKTTIIRCISDVLESNGLRVEFCAPTGRASKRLAESTGKDAKTIHRMLGFEYVADKMHFKYNRYNTLPCDVVVCDELSMVDVSIMDHLLQALENGTRLVLVGDKDQLPSVGAGNVLADIIRSKAVDVRCLTHIYRQSEDSLIVTNAHLINSGHMPEINNQSRDFFFTASSDVDVIADTIVDLVTTRLPGYTKLSADHIQVLCALKSGNAGVTNLNVRLQEALNPYRYGMGEITSGKTVLRQGDRVMQTVNNYELTYVKNCDDGTVEEGAGVFNGDIGYVTRVERSTGIVNVLFDDGRLAEYTSQDLSDLQLAYATTVHKSQGSEFDVVVISLVSGPPTIINKNLLYTAITRAKKMVVLVGNKKVLAMMVHNNYIAARTTNLCRFLQAEKKKFNQFFDDDADEDDQTSEQEVTFDETFDG